MKRFAKILLRFLPCAFDETLMNRVQIGTKTLWLYEHPTDALAAVVASAYFNDHAPLLRQGDVIIFTDPGTSIDVLAVSSADNATPVTVINGT